MRPLKPTIATVIALCASPALAAETLDCSTWLDTRTCYGPNGYTSRESTFDGLTFGDDNRGGSWTTSRWRGLDTTVITPPPR